MNLAQAIEHANSIVFPGFLVGDEAMTEERHKNEEALVLLMDAWKTAPLGQEPFSFDTVRKLADRNRELCDLYGTERLRDEPVATLARKLPDSDLVHAVAVMQHRSDADVARTAGRDLRDLGVAWQEAPVLGMILGIDLETTERDPARGYIINVGFEFMYMSPKARPTNGHAAYFGIPEMYKEKGVPLTEVHHITWKDLDGKTPFRKAKAVQEALIKILERYPFMAHNAAFEDSWLTLHLDGYAEGRKAGRIVPIDTRDICRRCDPEVKNLPREARPAALESWARRRKVLKKSQKERHLGLEDVDLMFKTVQAEFSERTMFAS